MTIITNDDDDDDDNNTNINDYSVILLKVYFLCFVATELFFPLPLFFKKRIILQGFLWSTLEPFLLTYPCWCWWTVPILFACSPCIAMSLLSLNYSICIDFFICLIFLNEPLFGGTAPPPVPERAGLCTAVQIHALSLGFLRIVLKHLPGLHRKAQLSPITRRFGKMCLSSLSAFSVWNSKKKKKKL